jgi:hypothetical protein
MNSFEKTIKELDKKKGEIDIDGAEKQAWVSGRCTKDLITSLTIDYLDALGELPGISTATGEGREESDTLKGKIQTLESILDYITTIPEEEE